MVKYIFCFSLIILSFTAHASSILIPMDDKQKEHLKAYGIAYFALKNSVESTWLLNYRGGSFMFKYSKAVENECRVRGVSFEVVSDGNVNTILSEIALPEVNMDAVKLETAPKIAVYSPKNTLLPDNMQDAVLVALDYAEIPYEIVYDQEIIKGDLYKYDWLHLHHEDFTGQYDHFRSRQPSENIKIQENIANKLGYQKVSQMKLDVARKIRDFCAGGGFLFAMCSGTETLEVALAADGVDICESLYDGDGADPAAQDKLNFSKTLAFQNFRLSENYSFGYSDINVTGSRNFGSQSDDYFTLFSFSAKWDPVPTMLTQDHDFVLKSFTGLTTAFKKSLLKPSVLIMGEDKKAGAARYIHGEFGKGQWTYYSGHDPEGQQGGRGGGGPGQTRDLSLTPNSPGYRLILNNVLFPSAKKQKQKT